MRPFYARAVRRLALLLATVAALGGCGGGQSDTEAVRDTVAEFGTATAEKDYDRLCGLLAPSLLDSLEQIGLPCRVALEQSLGKVDEPRLVIGAITVDGDKATVDVRSSAAGQAPSRDTLSLVRVEDRWRIADLGSAPAPRAEPSATP